MSGISLEGLPKRYQYLNLFNINGDKKLDEKDSPLFKGVTTPKQAEKVVMGNLPALSDMPHIPQVCTTAKELPPDYSSTPMSVERSVDGDTYKIGADFDGDGKSDSVRIDGVNTTEFGKGPQLRSRLRKAEPGAVEAWEKLKALFEEAKDQVFVTTGRRDSYRRIITQTYLKTKEGYVDLSAVLVQLGMGHAYFVEITDWQQYFCYLMLQAQAKKQGKGIWALPTFTETAPKGEKHKPIHITSFHPNARKVGPNEEPLYKEYFRIANTSDRPIDLGNYDILQRYNGFLTVEEDLIPLPRFIVPPGRTVKIATGEIKTNSDPEQDQLVLSLGLEKEFWKNKEDGGACLVIRTKDGQVIDSSAKYKFSACPE